MSDTLEFAPGETVKTGPVTIHGGCLAEGEDQLTVLLGITGATNATIGGFFGLGGINIVSP